MKKHNSIGYLLASLITLVVAMAAALVFVVLLKPSSVERLGSEGEEIISRTIEITGTGASTDDIVRKIDTGSLSVGDYVAASFTGSLYLLNSKDDAAFAQDLSYAVFGDDSKASDIEAELRDFSRKYVINEFASEADPSYAFTNELEDKTGSRIKSCEITKPMDSDSGYTIGIRQVEGVCDIDGKDVRTDFYVDGVIYQATIKYDDENSNNFKVSWDTSGVEEGYHEVKILLRSSDGRGFVAAGGDVLIPHCMQIENDGISIGSISANSDDSWYALFVDEGDCYVNFVDLSDDIAVSLYDIYGNKIGSNDMDDSEYETLRGKAQDIPTIEEDTGIDGLTSVYYVLVERSLGYGELEENPSKEAITYKMVQTPNVVRYDGNYYAVPDNTFDLPYATPLIGTDPSIKDREIEIRDVNGNDFTKTVGEVTFLPINGFLDNCSIKDFSTGDLLDICPIFDSKDQFYGFYCNGTPSTIAIDATPLEGYAADVSVTSRSAIGTSEAELGQSIALVPGENTIEINIDSFMGYTRTYTIYILNGDDKDGFSTSTLKQFPESYYSGLWMLHCMHPGYIFRPFNTELDYYTVLDNEDNVDRSLANSYSHPGWCVSGSQVYDNGGWKTAKYDVVNYFLDPRNFLSPDDIFQFEMLSFDPSAQTIEGVKSMISGSFMDNADIDYATIIYNAGQKANVSPYFLASRILQEMGYSGESPLCHGTLSGYEGYYNFYNIGSNPDPSIPEGARINGAKYAMWGKDPDGKTITPEEADLLLPWDNVEDAITGGALWIASRYTAAGQDTLYFQKFDVVNNDDGLYEHQYAQNISMAYSEGLRYFDSYASIGMLDQSFIFVIPVYTNMPPAYGFLPDP